MEESFSIHWDRECSRKYFVPTQSKSHLKESTPTTAIPLASKYHEWSHSLLWNHSILGLEKKNKKNNPVRTISAIKRKHHKTSNSPSKETPWLG